jgi:hypothetical protein
MLGVEDSGEEVLIVIARRGAPWWQQSMLNFHSPAQPGDNTCGDPFRTEPRQQEGRAISADYILRHYCYHHGELDHVQLLARIRPPPPKPPIDLSLHPQP